MSGILLYTGKLRIPNFRGFGILPRLEKSGEIGVVMTDNFLLLYNFHEIRES